MSAAELGLRSTPRQARSRATLERILVVSAELLEQVGVDGFNTNLLAEKAGLGVRAIYRYFPNKLAILVALAEAFSEAERDWIGDLRHLGADGDWRAAAERAIDGYYEAASRQRGFAALRAAAAATPALRELDALGNRALEDDLAEGLAGLGVTLEPAHMRALCRTIMETSNRMLDIALSSPRDEAERLVRELKRMIVALLETYVA